MNFRTFILACLVLGTLGQDDTGVDSTATTSDSLDVTVSTTVVPDDKNTTTSTPATPDTTTETTPAPDTTISPTTPKPAPTPTPAPAPSVKYFYNISNSDGVQCIMIDGKFSFRVTYNINNNKTNETVIVVPAPSASVNVTGSCGEKITDEQFIQVSWGDDISNNNIRLTFGAAKDSKNWVITNFTSKLFMDERVFINGSDAGGSLMSIVNVSLTPDQVPMNHSFMCFASLNFANITTKLDGGPYQYPVQMMVDGVQIQAFNNKKTAHNKFVEEIHCEADKIADVVPIAVGCALGVLVLIVLVAYVVGRRRRSGAYQSV